MSTKPNILVVMTDHQRADTVLPEHPAVTPNLDKMVAEGVTFAQTFCPTPHCCPARATFMTGLYPSRHGVWNNICNDMALSRGLNPGVRCWSEDLAAAGYQMHYTGKWHVSVEKSPADYGWKEYSVSAVAGTHHGFRWDQYAKRAAEGMPESTERGPGEIVRPGWGNYTLYKDIEEGGKGHDAKVVAEAIDFIPSAAKDGSPWCAFVGLIGPHDPYNVAKKYVDMYDLADVPLPASYADEMADKPRVYKRMRDTRFAGQLSDEEVRDGIRHFWAYCTYLDDLFGQVLKTLEETGQADNTLVLYCSDHGDYCGDHGLFCKGIPSFRGAYHVPAVMCWPKGIKDPGRRVDEFVSLADFGPTFLEVAGIESNREFSGASLAPFMRGETPGDWRDGIHTQCNGVELYYTQRSVMTRDWKYVFNGFDLDELYHVKDDPDEMVNLADNPEYESVKREMCQRMWRFGRREDDAAINPYITVSLAPYGPGVAFEESK